MVVAAGVGLAFAVAVVLPGVAGAVVAVAVELDGQAVGRPAAVDAVAAGGLVGLGERQAVGAQQGEEASFERAEGDVDVAPDDPAQGARSAGPRPSGQRGLDLGRGGVVADAGLVEGAGQLVWR